MKTVIPSSLERIRVLPIAFDNSLGKFMLGVSKQVVEPKNLHDLIRSDDYMDTQDIPRLSAGIVLGNTIVTGPVFHDFIETNEGNDAIKETPKVMLGVFNAVNAMKAKKDTIGGGFGFDAHRFREGQVNLSVLGDCACFGPDLYGYIARESAWKLKFAEYSEHNIDFPAQIISLYAGLGYIAGKAIEFSEN